MSTARNQAIYASYKAGKRPSLIAEEHGLSISRLYEVIAQCRQRARALLPKAPLPVRRIAPDAITLAECAAARLEASTAPLFRGWVGI